MKDQPWDLNLTWPVGRKWCRFTNAPKNYGGSPTKFGVQNATFLSLCFTNSALDIAYLRNKTSHWQTKMLVSIYNVSPKSWPTFRDHWPINVWDLFAHCDPPFVVHYIATIIVATYLVTFLFFYDNKYYCDGNNITTEIESCSQLTKLFGFRKRVPSLSCGILCVILHLAVVLIVPDLWWMDGQTNTEPQHTQC